MIKMKFYGKLLAVALAWGFPFGQGIQQLPLGNLLSDQEIKFDQSLTDNCHKACHNLRAQYGSQVSYINEELYDNELSRFWSLQQSQTFPACIFLPQSLQDVASAVLVSRKMNCPFAAKSGGHAAFSGASNIAGGVTIDLAGLNEVTVNKDRKTVSVGPGNRWVDVYRQLEKENLTVVGGRIADVGVGGLTLGGGISFFSNMYGWACDNVASYTVVTASGDAITASSELNTDLYWALRGGGNNFGLVTNFELLTYPQQQGLMWIGKVTHPGARNATLIEVFVDFGIKGMDPRATLLFSIVYVQKQDQFLCVSELDYAEPLLNETQHPVVFESFFNVADSLQVIKKTKTIVEVIGDHSASNPNGLRQSYWTATFSLDKKLAQEVFDLWTQEVNLIKNKVAGIVPVITFQVITIPMIQHMGDRRGNSLGLENEKAPLMLVALSAMWLHAADDAVISTAYAQWLAKSVARAKELGFDHPYLYMNYASQFQDPIQSYGNTNVARLKKIAKSYDPDEIFQKLQPGYFKL